MVLCFSVQWALPTNTLNGLHFTLGEANYRKPRPFQTASYPLIPDPWLREGIFREGDLEGWWLLLPLNKLNIRTCPCKF